MRGIALFVAAVSLIVECTAESSICSDFGNEFCRNAECEVVPSAEDDFVCKCPRDNMYFNAAEKQCEYKDTCKTRECSYGRCVESNPSKASCVCEASDDLTLQCKIKKEYATDCQNRGGTAKLRTDGFIGATCDCGEWGAMNKTTRNCVPTTCLRPDLTCKDLCEKNLLQRDSRCCQGWNTANCLAAPPADSYCSPGSPKGPDGQCKNACRTKEAGFVCKHGCRSTDKAYECTCPSGFTVAEDGITCKSISYTVSCTVEQKQTCRPTEDCRVQKGTVLCECPWNQHLVGDTCISDCVDKKCHEEFMDCGVYMNRQSCYCPWKSRKPGPNVNINECLLNEYYYTVSFTPNISFDSDHCKRYEDRVLEAIRTSIGKEVFKVEILNCTQDIKARLIAEKPLSKYVLRKLQACEHPIGEWCMMYPKLLIKKNSATEIEEENLCDSLLKNQEAAYKGQNKCVKVDNLFWFQCADGYTTTYEMTRGRLRRSVCKAGVSCNENEQLECANKGQICVYENGKANCQCPPDTKPGEIGCIERTTCNPKEIQECQDKKLECVYKNHKAECKCPDDHECSRQPAKDSCSEEDNGKCQSSGQRCVMENGKAVCKEKSEATTAATTTTKAKDKDPDPGKSSAAAVSATGLLLLLAATSVTVASL
uniref:Cell surface glycoprotein n=1 Tax=Rhipicephalus microplus TaxID=6941 RepID=A0A8E2Z8E9_RHIMP|nr:cell surface glycoprotein [Rhipicephalus microplus]